MTIAVILPRHFFVVRHAPAAPWCRAACSRWPRLGYEFVANMVRDNVGDAGKKYFPFIFTLFIFILFCNMLGMIPSPSR